MKRWPPEQHAKTDHLLERGRTLYQLAHDLGMRYEAVRSYCQRHGLMGRIIRYPTRGRRQAISVVTLVRAVMPLVMTEFETMRRVAG